MTPIHLMDDVFVFLQRFNVPDDCNTHETNGRTL